MSTSRKTLGVISQCIAFLACLVLAWHVLGNAEDEQMAAAAAAETSQSAAAEEADIAWPFEFFLN